MCGIVGYIGLQDATPILLNGLKRLEYRGYDSAGLAIVEGRELRVCKRVGKLQNLQATLDQEPIRGSMGLGHTRWATHGKPNESNAHPHLDCSHKIAVVHNGIIENYQFLKERLIKEGHHFSSETDTEVITHLIEKHLHGDLEEAVRRALLQVEGSFALGVISLIDPDKVIGVRFGSPLVVGLGKGEFFLASDLPALLPYTREELLLDDGELVVLSRNGVQVATLRENKSLTKPVHRILWDPVQAEKGGYPHFMLKEIHEQPIAIQSTLTAHLCLADREVRFPELSEALLQGIHRVMVVGCGTSYHAGLVGKYLIERLVRLPVEVDIASEFRYRDPLVDEKTLTLAVTQSGGTADTLAAMKEARSKGSPVIAVCNMLGSSAARLADGVIYTHAGPEIGVASTKAFTTQLVALMLFSLYVGQQRGIIQEGIEVFLEDLKRLPDLVRSVLAREHAIKQWATRFLETRNFMYLGRGLSHPIALEGALKLKEISYIHAEAYPAGEMKHGPIALIDKGVPVIILAPQGPLYTKIMNNLEEVKSRDGIVIALATDGDHEIVGKVDHVFYLPQVNELLMPVLQMIPLQLLAYFIAVQRGCDVDQPRNLAKSVTVE